MKIEHFMILFGAILAAFLVVTCTITDINKTANKETLDYRRTVDAAVEGAMETVLAKNNYAMSSGDRNLWNEKNMEYAKNTVMHTLELDLGYPLNTGKDKLQWAIPLYLFVDNDGYYISYVDDYDADDGFMYSNHMTTGLIPWTETVEQWTIRYTMSDDIEILYEDGRTIHGKRNEVYEQMMQTEDVSELYFLNDPEEFKKRKNEVTIRKMENDLNHYLEIADTTLERYGMSYEYILDLHENGTEQDLNHQGMAVFFQGPMANTTNAIISIYTTASWELTKAHAFAITLDDITEGSDIGFTYHDFDCEILNEKTPVRWATTVREAAAYGAYPCPDCRP